MDQLPRSTIQLAVVGDVESAEFRDLVAFVYRQQDCQTVAEFSTLRQFLDSSMGESRPPDLLLVLQSWSDQFTPVEVNSLIGRMMFRRVFCCYGIWCESDGRTRDLWPPMMRIPVRIAVPAVELCLSSARRGFAVLPATASAEEVFFARLVDDGAFQPLEIRNKIFLVISSDDALRRTVASMLEALGMHAIETGSHVDHLAGYLRTLQQKPRTIVLDLDEPRSIRTGALKQIREMLPAAAIWGLCAFPDSSSSEEWSRLGIDRLLPKQDLLYGLRSVFREVADHSQR